MATIFNQGTLTFTPAGGQQTSVVSNITGTELNITYGLEVAHAASATTCVEGDTVRYTVFMRNTGSGTLYDVEANVDLADGALDYVQGSAVAFLYVNGTATDYPVTVTQNGGVSFSFSDPLPAGVVAYLIYDTVVNQSGAAQQENYEATCTPISTVTVTAHEGAADGPVISDSATAEIECQPVSIVKSAPDSASVGDTVQFSFNVTNNTCASIGFDSLTDQLPEQFGLTAVTLTRNGTTVTLTEGSDYTLSPDGLLSVAPAGTLVLSGGETVVLNVIGVITA